MLKHVTNTKEKNLNKLKMYTETWRPRKIWPLTV